LLSLDHKVLQELDILVVAAESAKQKDAAGLGAMAQAYREGDRSMLGCVPDERMLRTVAEALGRPAEFFRWALSASTTHHGTETIAAAQRYFRVASWEWDKACILAGALHATTGWDSLCKSNSTVDSARFPYWIALDKHTDEGKAVLREVAKAISVSYRQLTWTSFYCESARANELAPSPWFSAERKWRLAKAGLSYEAAQVLWERARVLVQERLEDDAEALRRLVESAPALRAPQSGV
jgi:hypothetical protein